MASHRKVTATFCRSPEVDWGAPVPASEALGEHYEGYDVDARGKDGIVTPKPVRPCFTAASAGPRWK